MNNDLPSTEMLEELRTELAREIEARQKAEAALEHALSELQQSRDQFQAVLDAVPGGVSWINTDLKYLGINSRLASTFQLTPQEFIGKEIGFLNSSPGFAEFVREFVNSDEQSASREMDMMIEGVRRVYLMMAQKYLHGQSAVFVGIDITERKQAEEKLFHDAFFDKLTQLPNRALLLERLERSLEFAKRRDNYLFAVLFLDFDDFKIVNDSLGHTNGDKLLSSIARRLETATRTADTVARLGGDEFVILLDDIEGLHDATQIAERIQRALAVPFNLAGQEIFISVSIGITLNMTEYNHTEEILRDADTAMYRAKIQGRNRYEVFDRHMHAQAIQRLELESDLHRSLDQQDFLLHYQPIVHLETGNISGFEALVRWQRPKKGFTVPGDFIALAEETGLIVRLDRWVLYAACQQMCAWLQHHPRLFKKSDGSNDDVTISVNLSSRQFGRKDLVEFVSNMLRETGLPPRNLKLEITESVIMENIDSVAVVLQGLRDLGIRLCVDDFGTGYSSLSYLHRLPLNTLKVDRSFVNQIGDGNENMEIVRAIVSMAHSLKMDVVAEGIETDLQLKQFRELSCEYAQGHLFSTALEPDAAADLLAQPPKW